MYYRKGVVVVPVSLPQMCWITVSMDLHDGSSAHSWWANRQFRMALAGWPNPLSVDIQRCVKDDIDDDME